MAGFDNFCSPGPEQHFRCLDSYFYFPNKHINMKCLQAVTIYILNKASAVCQSVNMNISCLVFNGDKQYYKQFYRQRNKQCLSNTNPCCFDLRQQLVIYQLLPPQSGARRRLAYRDGPIHLIHPSTPLIHLSIQNHYMVI